MNFKFYSSFSKNSRVNEFDKLMALTKINLRFNILNNLNGKKVTIINIKKKLFASKYE